VAAVDEAKALLTEAKQSAAAIRAAADRDADEQREAAATLLHEARQRADHEVGALTEALGQIRARLAGPGIGGHPADPVAAGADDGRDDETQLMPTPTAE
jgi:hypothetical protein